MHLKCDETRPSCKKCGVYDVVCPGYSTLQPGVITFIDQTSLIVKRAKWRKNPPAIVTSHLDHESTSVLKTNAHSSLEALPEDGVLFDPTLPQQIKSAVINREQMFDVSMKLYLPHDEHDARPNHFTTFTTLQLQDAKQPALLAAVDTLSLVQLAVSFKDPRLHWEARRAYGKALPTLMRALARPNAHLDGEILAAITILEFCEVCKVVTPMFCAMFIPSLAFQPNISIWKLGQPCAWA